VPSSPSQLLERTGDEVHPHADAGSFSGGNRLLRVLDRPRVQAGADRERVGEVNALVEGDLVLGEEQLSKGSRCSSSASAAALRSSGCRLIRVLPEGRVITENIIFSVIEAGKAIRPLCEPAG
jgi:hypothetical protein